MKIKYENIREFKIEVDSDGNTLRLPELDTLFLWYPNESIMKFVSDSNGSLSLNSDGVSANSAVFKYLVDQNILSTTTLPHFFWVTDIDRLRSFITELNKTYKDLITNYEIYEREFLIDSII